MTTLIVADDSYSHHLTGWGHPESPERYPVIIEALKKAGLMTDVLPPRLATKEEVLLAHTEEYYERVKKECALLMDRGLTEGDVEISTGDAPICPESFHIAKLAAGGILTAIDAIMEGKATNAFTPVRPPGHHATRSRGMGFCLFNNIAIGAKYLQEKYGLQRILIADPDIHHGNGTEDIIRDDPGIFYFSSHQHPFYPGTGKDSCEHIHNVPIAPSNTSRQELLKAFGETLPHLMEEFKPQFVLVSMGFDSHIDDPIGGFNLMTEDFATLTDSLKNIAEKHCDRRLLSTLEGGYNLEALANSAVAHVRSLC